MGASESLLKEILVKISSLPRFAFGSPVGPSGLGRELCFCLSQSKRQTFIGLPNSNIMTYKELLKKWGDCPDRQKMSVEQEREYVTDWYKVGKHLPKKPFSPLCADDEAYRGQDFTIIGCLQEEEADLECLPIWRICMNDDRELEVLCDEIFQI